MDTIFQSQKFNSILLLSFIVPYCAKNLKNLNLGTHFGPITKNLPNGTANIVSRLVSQEFNEILFLFWCLYIERILNPTKFLNFICITLKGSLKQLADQIQIFKRLRKTILDTTFIIFLNCSFILKIQLNSELSAGSSKIDRQL